MAVTVAGTEVVMEGKHEAQAPNLIGKSMNDYRDVARKKLLPEGYSGYSHLLWLFGGCIVVFALSFMLMDPITLRDILTIPFVFVIGNAYEYVVHRYPMHVPSANKIHRVLFKSHTGLHHKFYTYAHMRPDRGHLDWYFTLFPLRLYAMYFIVGSGPMIVFGPYFLPLNICLITSCCGASYLFMYEVVHSYAHDSLPPAVLNVLSYVPGFNFIKQYHRMHHHPRLMTSKNFNITFPLTDWLMGTMVTKLPS